MTTYTQAVTVDEARKYTRAMRLTGQAIGADLIEAALDLIPEEIAPTEVEITDWDGLRSAPQSTVIVSEQGGIFYKPFSKTDYWLEFGTHQGMFYRNIALPVTVVRIPGA